MIEFLALVCFDSFVKEPKRQRWMTVIMDLGMKIEAVILVGDILLLSSPPKEVIRADWLPECAYCIE